MEDFTREFVYYLIKVNGKYFATPSEQDGWYDETDYELGGYSNLDEWRQLTDSVSYAYQFYNFGLPKYIHEEHWYWDVNKNEDFYKGNEPESLEELIQHFKLSYNTDKVEAIKVIKTEVTTYKTEKVY